MFHHSSISETNNTNNGETRRSKRSKANRSEPITYYELVELERQRNEQIKQATAVKIKIKRHFPIAPDGFIPNSVVRKFFKLFDNTTKPPEKKIWKLKWVYEAKN